jgi:hypothetical protein
MRRFRFSIRSLLILVLFIGVAFAALRASNDAWDSGNFGLTLLILLMSVLLAVHRTDRRRSFWLGFALFGWANLVASLVPTVASRLPTTKGLASLDSMILRTTWGGVLADLDNDGDLDHFVVNSSGTSALDRNQGNGTFTDVTASQAAVGNAPPPSGDVILWNTTPTWKFVRGSGTTENFIKIGHSLVALVLAFVGGFWSRWLDDRNDVGTSGGSHPEIGRNS